ARAAGSSSRGGVGPHAHHHESGPVPVYGGRDAAGQGVPFPARTRGAAVPGLPGRGPAEATANGDGILCRVGFPHAANAIRPGDTVLDIGSGSGTDVLYASLKTG